MAELNNYKLVENFNILIDDYTKGHSDRVSHYSVLIGKKLGLPEDEITTLRIGRFIS